jgi:hypothetical protein
MKIVRLENAISEARKLAEEKLAIGEGADEFVEIGEADGFKLYVTDGKTMKEGLPISFHENPRDIFMAILEGENKFAFQNNVESMNSVSRFHSFTFIALE